MLKEVEMLNNDFELINDTIYCPNFISLRARILLSLLKKELSEEFRRPEEVEK